MKNISEILAGVEETPTTFEDYLKAYADPVGELINSYIPHGTHGDMDRYLYDPLYHYSENAGKRHRPLICFAACLAVVLLGAVCVPKLMDPAPQGEQVAIANGMIEVADAAALADAVGFPAAEAAELPFDVEETTYTSYWGELAEICYAGGEQIADLRTSAGTEDNSGDYTDYPAVTELTVGTVTAELRGEAAERYTLAVWTDGQYAYSLRLSDGQSTEVWQRLLAGVRTEG